MRPCFLIGFMASGKTTLGRALGARPGYRFLDLDEEVEKEAGMKVADIFAMCGEEYFRNIESRVLRRVVSEAEKEKDSTLVIACGGGTPCHHGNMEFMNSTGTCVLLQASDDVILRRLREAPAGKRPLVDSSCDDDELLAFIAERRQSRRYYYEKASCRFDSSRLESESEINCSVERFIKELNI